jgi:hypothetical protein
MDENVMRVLQMLQEGKISAQEAETLIAALRGEAPGAHEAEKPTVESNTEEKEDKSLFDSLPFNKVNKVNEQIKDKIKE